MFNVKCKIQKGMSLTELMVTIAIMGIIGSVMWIVLLQGFRMWRLGSAQTEVQRDVRRILDLVSRNVRQATASTITISKNSSSDPPFSKITFIGLKQGATTQISYYQSGRRFYQKVAGVTTRFGKNIRSLNFATVESGDSGVISIGLCLEKATYEGKTRIAKLSVRQVRIMN